MAIEQDQLEHVGLHVAKMNNDLGFRLYKDRRKAQLRMTNSLPVQTSKSRSVKISRNLKTSSGSTPDSASPLQVRDDLIFTSRKRRTEQAKSTEGDNLLTLHRTQFKILQVQEKFPHDNLRLTESPDSPTQRMKALSNRRRSAPNAVINKILNKSSSNLSIDDNSRGSSPSPTSSPIPTESKPRTYIQEGCVQLATGVSSQTRYMFLFNDILLVAKSKSVSSYKLKNRVRVSEMWMGTCIDEVTETTVPAERSFVIGWPTANYVATFSTTEEKELWWTSLRKCINEQRDLEEKKDVLLKVCKRDMEDGSVITKSLSVSIFDDANTVTKMSLDNFHLAEESASDYQLWVISGKENVAYPLIGHEIPFSIKMNHVREALMEGNERCLNNNLDDGPVLSALSPEAKCEFILKKAKKAGARINLDIPSAQKRWKNPMKKSPIINWAMNKKAGKGNMSQDMIAPGKLFGLPLTSLTTDEEFVPKPIEVILVQLFKKGPSTIGIFRKSGLMKTMKQVRQALNEGIAVDLDDKPAVLLSTILKEFFRSLPDCIFGSEFYDEFVATKDISDAPVRAEEIKKILNKLPKPNQELIKRFLCLAFFIAKYSERNSMTASNLAVCIAPSLIWPPGQEKLMSPETTGNAADFVCFVIENFVAIYGEESLTLLGDESDICLDPTPLQEEDSEQSGEHIIYQQNDTSPDSPRKPPELRASLSYGGEYIGAHDDESHSSEERLNLNNSLNLTSVSLFPGKIGDSKSSPSSPFPSRRRSPPSGKPLKASELKSVENGFLDGRVTIRRHSDQDINEDGSTKGTPKYTRVKRALMSTTTSAELIEHRRPFQNDLSPRITGKENHNGSTSPQTVKVVSPAAAPQANKPGALYEPHRSLNHRTYYQTVGENSGLESPIDLTERLSGFSFFPRGSSGGSNHGSETSSSDGRCSPHRSPLSSPVLRKKFQFVEGQSNQADIVMQNFYRRQQPAAPSYDEHIQRRQLLHRQGVSQRLGSDSDNERPVIGRSDVSGVDRQDPSLHNRRVDLVANIGDSDERKNLGSPRSTKEGFDFKPLPFDLGRPYLGEREMGRSQPNMEPHGYKSYLSTGREGTLTDKLSPRPANRRLETEVKNSSDSSIYSRLGGETGRSQTRPQGRGTSRTLLDNHNSKNEHPLQSSFNGKLYTGIPVKSNFAHFPESDFFPKEAKPSLKSSGEVFYQSPWFKEDTIRELSKGGNRVHEPAKKVDNNNVAEDKNMDSTHKNDNHNENFPSLDVNAIPRLTDSETPTLEDFQNFMFQDESRV